MRDRARIALLLTLLALPLLVAGADDESPEQLTKQADERLLKESGLSADRAVLLRFFKFRTLSDADRVELPKLTEKLGHDSFEEREAAQNALLARGPSARPILEKNLKHADVEVARRCRELCDLLDHGPGAALPRAAVRVLSRSADKGITPVLLDYLPFADDESVVEEVLDGLVRLPKEMTAPLLRTALTSAKSERRAAAGYVLGRSNAAAVVPLLADEVGTVRYRTAQALLAAQDRRAIPAYLALLNTAPAGIVYRIEETLFNLAGANGPQVSVGTATTEERAKASTAWAAWWKANESKVDLARANQPSEFVGLNVVPEMHANKVWECGRDGKPLWELAGLHCPIDAQVLPGQRLLVAELNGNRVTERDRTGKIFWEFKVDTPIACQRLPGGATWIATNHRFFTVSAEGREVSTYTPENGFFIHSAYRLRSGNVAVVSMAGEIREITPAGAVVRSLPLTVQGSWSGISVTPLGRYLVANVGQGLVQEVDQAGKVVWEFRHQGACYATRLPGGTTLVVCNGGGGGLIEVNRDGAQLFEVKTATSLWRGHRR